MRVPLSSHSVPREPLAAASRLRAAARGAARIAAVAPPSRRVARPRALGTGAAGRCGPSGGQVAAQAPSCGRSDDRDWSRSCTHLRRSGSCVRASPSRQKIHSTPLAKWGCLRAHLAAAADGSAPVRRSCCSACGRPAAWTWAWSSHRSSASRPTRTSGDPSRPGSCRPPWCSWAPEGNGHPARHILSCRAVRVTASPPMSCAPPRAPD